MVGSRSKLEEICRHFTSREPMRYGATCSAGRAKKAWGGAGRVLVAMGVARCEMVEYNELRVIENEPT